MEGEITERVEGKTEGATVSKPSPKDIEKARQIIAWIKDDYDIIGCDVKREHKRGFKSVISVYRKEGGKVYVVNIRDYIKNRCEDREHIETDFEGAARILAKFGRLETAEKIESVKKTVDNYLNAIGYRGE